jgi:hypothetical protein
MKTYHQIMERLFSRLWQYWHVKLPWHVFKVERLGDSRPWFHFCCHGNEGGWQTSACKYLENKREKYRDKIEGVET